jgi:hypothetical protein
MCGKFEPQFTDAKPGSDPEASLKIGAVNAFHDGTLEGSQSYRRFRLPIEGWLPPCAGRCAAPHLLRAVGALRWSL